MYHYMPLIFLKIIFRALRLVNVITDRKNIFHLNTVFANRIYVKFSMHFNFFGIFFYKFNSTGLYRRTKYASVSEYCFIQIVKLILKSINMWIFLPDFFFTYLSDLEKWRQFIFNKVFFILCKQLRKMLAFGN